MAWTYSLELRALRAEGTSDEARHTVANVTVALRPLPWLYVTKGPVAATIDVA